MKTLAYGPLFLAVLALQAIAATTEMLSRFDAAAAITLSLVCTGSFAAALYCAFRLSRRSYVAGNAAQLAQLALVGALVGAWLMLRGATGIFVVFALSLLLVRDFFLTTRRALYFDLAILLTLFYNSIGFERLPYRWPLAITFLLALMFLLIADYTDRRLAQLKIADTRRVNAVFPALRNAVFAGALTLLIAVLIYVLMPQPRALNFAAFPDRGPPTALGELPGAGSSKGEGKDGPGSGDGKDKKGGDKGDEKSEDGKGTGNDRSKTGEGAGEQQSKGGKGSGEPQSKGGGSGGGAGKGKGFDPAGGASGGGKGAGGGSGGGKGPGGGSGGKTEAEAQVGGVDQPFLLLLMRADRPLYLRTRAYAIPANDGWQETPGSRVETPAHVIERKGAPRGGVLQLYKVMEKLDDRIPVAHAFSRVQLPTAGFTVSIDGIVQADQPLVAGLTYAVESLVHYLGDRPSGAAEPQPPLHYLAMPPGVTPRVRALARELTAGRDGVSDKAIALEQHLRAHYKPAAFKARDGIDPVDQFLFDARGGSSRQFAGALAVMLRAIGIPSRIMSGYRARRLNPIHEHYEIWATDQHHWVEAYIHNGWTTFDPSPWSVLPARRSPDWFDAAREYVRLAREPAIDTILGGGQQPRIKEWYLNMVLVWGWLATYGKLLLLAIIAFAAAAWRWRWWSLPIRDAFDRMRLRRAARGDPASVVRTCYATIERMATRRNLARARTENHSEFLGRVANTRPHLATPCRILASSFAAARYGQLRSANEAREAWEASRIIADLIDEKRAR